MMSSSTVRLELGVVPQSKPNTNAAMITFQVNKVKQAALAGLALAPVTAGIRLIDDKQMIAVDELDVILDDINLALTNKEIADKERILLEQYKLLIMKNISVHLNQLNDVIKVKKPDATAGQSRFLHWLKIGFFVLIGLIGLVGDGVFGFLGMRELLLMAIPAIPNPALIAVSVIITAINAIQFIAFDLGMLKSMAGVSTTSNAKLLLKTHQKQVDVTNEINHELADVNVLAQMSEQDYRSYRTIALKCNQDLSVKKAHYAEYHEHPARKAARWILTGFGTLMVAAGTYFGVSTLLATMAAPLLATPVGLIIIGTLMLTSVVFYLAMQNQGLKNLLNPALEAFNAVKAKLATLTVKTERDLDKPFAHKQIFKSGNQATGKVEQQAQLQSTLDKDDIIMQTLMRDDSNSVASPSMNS
jgi:hypothetical protein